MTDETSTVKLVTAQCVMPYLAKITGYDCRGCLQTLPISIDAPNKAVAIEKAMAVKQVLTDHQILRDGNINDPVLGHLA